MRDFRDAKAMGGSLRKALTARGYSITHSESLEFISAAFGFDNWNILSAKIEAAAAAPTPLTRSPTKPGEPNGTLYCSFCGKSQHEVKKLIAGPAVFICNECVGLCDAIVADEAEIDRLLIEEQNGSSLDTLLAERSDDQLLALKRTATATSDHCGRAIQITQAVLSGASMTQDASTQAEDRVLESALRSRPQETLKSELAGMIKRKTNADRILAELTKALATRGNTAAR